MRMVVEEPMVSRSSRWARPVRLHLPDFESMTIARMKPPRVDPYQHRPNRWRNLDARTVWVMDVPPIDTVTSRQVAAVDPPDSWRAPETWAAGWMNHQPGDSQKDVTIDEGLRPWGGGPTRLPQHDPSAPSARPVEAGSGSSPRR